MQQMVAMQPSYASASDDPPGISQETKVKQEPETKDAGTKGATLSKKADEKASKSNSLVRQKIGKEKDKDKDKDKAANKLATAKAVAAQFAGVIESSGDDS